MAPQPSIYYERYGAMYPNDPRLNSTGKISALTPIARNVQNARVSKEDATLVALRQKYQKNNFLASFTTRELIDMDVINDRPMKQLSLPAGILPVLDKAQWDATGRYPDGSKRRWRLRIEVDGQGGTSGQDCVNYGHWTVANRRVWRVIKPVLQIATAYLTSQHMLPFFDMLLNAPRVPVADDRKPDTAVNDALVQISTPAQTVNNIAAMIQARDDMFAKLVKSGILYVFDDEIEVNIIAHTQPQPTERPTDLPTRASISLNPTNWGYLITNDRLSEAERHAITWSLAVTVVHELMHAILIMRGIQARDGNPQIPTDQLGHDPYLGTRPVAEIGYEMEQFMNGGIHHALLQNRHDVPPLGYVIEVSKWPTTASSTLAPVLKSPPRATEHSMYPIPISLYEDMHSDIFWLCTKKFAVGPLLYRLAVQERTGVWSDLSRGVDRIRENAPFPDTSMRLEVNIEYFKGLEPGERNLAMFCNSIIESAKAGSEYSEATSQVEENVGFINEALMGGLGIGAANDSQHKSSMVELLSDACRAYNWSVEKLLDWEIKQGKQAFDVAARPGIFASPQRRQDSMAFNRGMQQLLREFVRAWTWDVNSDEDNTNQNELCKCIDTLELSELRLCDPEDSFFQGTQLQQEFERLELASRHLRSTPPNYKRCQDLVAPLIKQTGSSPTLPSFTVICANILRQACLPVQASDEPMTEMLRWHARLLSLGSQVESSSKWKEIIATWAQNADEMAHHCWRGPGQYGGLTPSVGKEVGFFLC